MTSRTHTPFPLGLGLMLLLSAPGPALAQSVDAGTAMHIDDAVPSEWVWVEAHRGSDEAWIAGFYREPVRSGERWIDPHVDAWGVSVPGHWIPRAPADGETYLWVPGHRDEDGSYIQGFWRLESVEGFAWIEGYYTDDERWISGYWRPVAEREASVWVPGYVFAPGRTWRIGFWRPSVMDGYSWVDGYYADGHWHGGYWSPHVHRSGFVWVPGYASAYHWSMGYWRPAIRHGYSWVPGYWDGFHWVAGHWYAGHWHRPSHVHVGHYAHYHHTHGHDHSSGHSRTREVRYASADRDASRRKPVANPKKIIVIPPKEGQSSPGTKPAVVIQSKEGTWKSKGEGSDVDAAQRRSPRGDRETDPRSERRFDPDHAPNPRFDPPRTPRDPRRDPRRGAAEPKKAERPQAPPSRHRVERTQRRGVVIKRPSATRSRPEAPVRAHRPAPKRPERAHRPAPKRPVVIRSAPQKPKPRATRPAAPQRPRVTRPRHQTPPNAKRQAPKRPVIIRSAPQQKPSPTPAKKRSKRSDKVEKKANRRARRR